MAYPYYGYPPQPKSNITLYIVAIVIVLIIGIGAYYATKTVDNGGNDINDDLPDSPDVPDRPPASKTFIWQDHPGSMLSGETRDFLNFGHGNTDAQCKARCAELEECHGYRFYNMDGWCKGHGNKNPFLIGGTFDGISAKKIWTS